MIIISDTSPLNYLVLIGQVERLPDLYGQVIIPQAVLDELQAEQTPEGVHAWLMSAPAWLKVQPLTGAADSQLDYLGPGEREAITLA